MSFDAFRLKVSNSFFISDSCQIWHKILHIPPECFLVCKITAWHCTAPCPACPACPEVHLGPKSLNAFVQALSCCLDLLKHQILSLNDAENHWAPDGRKRGKKHEKIFGKWTSGWKMMMHFSGPTPSAMNEETCSRTTGSARDDSQMRHLRGSGAWLRICRSLSCGKSSRTSQFSQKFSNEQGQWCQLVMPQVGTSCKPSATGFSSYWLDDLDISWWCILMPRWYFLFDSWAKSELCPPEASRPLLAACYSAHLQNPPTNSTPILHPQQAEWTNVKKNIFCLCTLQAFVILSISSQPCSWKISQPRLEPVQPVDFWYSIWWRFSNSPMLAQSYQLLVSLESC